MRSPLDCAYVVREREHILRVAVVVLKRHFNYGILGLLFEINDVLVETATDSVETWGAAGSDAEAASSTFTVYGINTSTTTKLELIFSTTAAAMLFFGVPGQP